jgi:hypothetical protein
VFDLRHVISLPTLRLHPAQSCPIVHCIRTVSYFAPAQKLVTVMAENHATLLDRQSGSARTDRAEACHSTTERYYCSLSSLDIPFDVPTLFQSTRGKNSRFRGPCGRRDNLSLKSLINREVWNRKQRHIMESNISLQRGGGRAPGHKGQERTRAVIVETGWPFE